MINRYRKGRAFEYKVKKRLEAEGSLVFRTAGSHGAADLIEIQPYGKDANGSRVRFIQCKAARPTKAELLALRIAKLKWGCTWAMAWADQIKDI